MLPARHDEPCTTCTSAYLGRICELLSLRNLAMQCMVDEEGEYLFALTEVSVDRNAPSGSKKLMIDFIVRADEVKCKAEMTAMLFGFDTTNPRQFVDQALRAFGQGRNVQRNYGWTLSLESAA